MGFGPYVIHSFVHSFEAESDHLGAVVRRARMSSWDPW
ncbi:hypothetical protein L083_6730 [Actinoplanes sp. N902-109]|nr:hypothetical protein L083_6730 [Actinoplanes sp. N902-109]